MNIIRKVYKESIRDRSIVFPQLKFTQNMNDTNPNKMVESAKCFERIIIVFNNQLKIKNRINFIKS
jgi:hypothetical protein